jgi:hypothetical protein
MSKNVTRNESTRYEHGIRIYYLGIMKGVSCCAKIEIARWK